jgi:hypothetical protein
MFKENRPPPEYRAERRANHRWSSSEGLDPISIANSVAPVKQAMPKNSVPRSRIASRGRA